MHSLFLTLLLICLVLFAAPTSAQPNDRAAQADDFFRRFADARGFSGAALIIRDGVVLLDEGYGLADDATQTAVTPDTVFDIGSISKQFTAAAVMQLVSDGALSVDATISTYLDDVPADKDAITVHQLLTHTSGLGGHGSNDLQPMTRAEALVEIFAGELAFAPGTRYSYSNSGYTVLAAVIEQVSGMPFTDYMHERVFAPAGLTHTGFYNDDWTGQPIARAYFNGETTGVPSTWGNPSWVVLGNGGILSTTGDLARWWAALHVGDIVAEEQAALLFTPHTLEEGGESSYGYGWVISESPLGAAIGHDGGGIGGNGAFTAVTDTTGSELVIITLGNRIVYQELFGLECHVEVYATEANEQLIANLADGGIALPAATIALC